MCCELCHRENIKLTFHHLVPRKMHKKKYVRNQHPDLDFNKHGIMVCIPCHKSIHLTFTHRELAQRFYTLERLLSSEQLKSAIAFNAKQEKMKRPR